MPGGRPGQVLDLLYARFRDRRYAPHTHEEFAIGACTEGVEVIRYRGAAHHAGPGTVVVIEPGEVHTGGRASDVQGYSYRALYPRTEILAESGPHPHFAEPVVHDPQLARELTIAHTLLSAGGDPLEAETRLVGSLTTLVRRHSTARPAPPADPGRAVTQAIRDRLAGDLSQPPTLAQLAGETGLSRYQIVRAFHREVGMTPYAWLAQYRVQRARGLLETGCAPGETAALVGFADQAHLTRWFVRVLGVTPGVYRNSVQDNAGRWRRF